MIIEYIDPSLIALIGSRTNNFKVVLVQNVGTRFPMLTPNKCHFENISNFNKKGHMFQSLLNNSQPKNEGHTLFVFWKSCVSS